MPDLISVEVWVKVSVHGDYAVGTDFDSCRRSFDEKIGSDGPERFVKVTLHIPKPRPVELEATVAEEASTGSIKAV